MCNGRCETEFNGECTLEPFDPNKCTLEILDGDIGSYDIPLELRKADYIVSLI